MECWSTIVQAEEWVKEVELRSFESDHVDNDDLFLHEVPIVPEPDLDSVKLRNIADSIYDSDEDGAPGMTEEDCVKTEMLQALLFILPADAVLQLSHIIPEVYINDDCRGKRPRTKLSCATPPSPPRAVPDVCEFRCRMRTVREYILFTSKLKAVQCDTIACFHIDELLLNLISEVPLQAERVPCECKDRVWDSDSSEAEYIQELMSSCSEEHNTVRLIYEEENLESDIRRPQPRPDQFQHRGLQETEDSCHCDMCVERRELDNRPGAHPEVDLHTVWQAFYDVQIFLEEYASFKDLSYLCYVEQRLCRITQYTIMEWFSENGLHSYSDFFWCPCSEMCLDSE